tara:strand:+ start:982 stop:1134 length:153 start_codon:yes stop_codon:yes gene_type:complete
MKNKDLKELEKLEKEFEKYLKEDTTGDFKIRILLDGIKKLKKTLKNESKT